MQEGACIFHLDLGICKPCLVDIRRKTIFVGKAVRAVVLLLLLSQKEGTGRTYPDNGNVCPFFWIWIFLVFSETYLSEDISTSFPERGCKKVMVPHGVFGTFSLYVVPGTRRFTVVQYKRI